MVNYEIYHYDPEIKGYGEWAWSASTKKSTMSLTALARNVNKAFNDKSVETGKRESDGLYVVAVLEGTEEEFEEDYWACLKYDVVVKYDKNLTGVFVYKSTVIKASD